MASAMGSVKHLAVMFGAMSLMKAVDQEDPQVIAYCRLLFGTYLFAPPPLCVGVQSSQSPPCAQLTRRVLLRLCVQTAASGWTCWSR